MLSTCILSIRRRHWRSLRKRRRRRLWQFVSSGSGKHHGVRTAGAPSNRFPPNVQNSWNDQTAASAGIEALEQSSRGTVARQKASAREFSERRRQPREWVMNNLKICPCAYYLTPRFLFFKFQAKFQQIWRRRRLTSKIEKSWNENKRAQLSEQLLFSLLPDDLLSKSLSLSLLPPLPLCCLFYLSSSSRIRHS